MNIDLSKPIYIEVGDKVHTVDIIDMKHNKIMTIEGAVIDIEEDLDIFN